MLNKRSTAAGLALATIISVQSAIAQDGSLESMWMDQPAPPGKEETVAITPPSPVTSTAAPMCSLADFKASAFVAKGSWPGVGPFSAGGSESELVDPNQNKLKVDLASGQITRAELGLGKLGGSSGSRDFLDIEMTADFLLEGLGVRPKKIAEFNASLEKSRENLMARPTSAQVPAGRYLVTIDRTKQSGQACVISVQSLNADKAIIREHSGAPDPAPAKVETPIASATTATPKQPKPPAVKPAAKPAVKPATQAMNPTIDPRRDEFVQAIKNWQNIKKVAIKKRDTTELPNILAGKALNRQTDAVKWLVTNKKFYDMTPKGVTVDKYQEQVPGKKYLVLAQVSEFSKFIDEGTGQVLKEVDDRYTVNYTIEKVGDKFMITDSALLASSNGTRPATPQKR